MRNRDKNQAGLPWNHKFLVLPSPIYVLTILSLLDALWGLVEMDQNFIFYLYDTYDLYTPGNESNTSSQYHGFSWSENEHNVWRESYNQLEYYAGNHHCGAPVLQLQQYWLQTKIFKYILGFRLLGRRHYDCTDGTVFCPGNVSVACLARSAVNHRVKYHWMCT